LGSFGGGVSKLVLYLSTVEYVTLMEGILTFNQTAGKITINQKTAVEVQTFWPFIVHFQYRSGGSK